MTSTCVLSCSHRVKLTGGAVHLRWHMHITFGPEKSIHARHVFRLFLLQFPYPCACHRAASVFVLHIVYLLQRFLLEACRMQPSTIIFHPSRKSIPSNLSRLSLYANRFIPDPCSRIVVRRANRCVIPVSLVSHSLCILETDSQTGYSVE